MQLHEQQEPSLSKQAEVARDWTFQDLVDATILFAGIPALVLNILFWSVATAFGGGLATVLALLITILLALLGIVLFTHYIAAAVTHSAAYNADSNGPHSDTHLNLAIGTWAAC